MMEGEVGLKRNIQGPQLEVDGASVISIQPTVQASGAEAGEEFFASPSLCPAETTMAKPALTAAVTASLRA